MSTAVPNMRSQISIEVARISAGLIRQTSNEPHYMKGVEESQFGEGHETVARFRKLVRACTSTHS